LGSGRYSALAFLGTYDPEAFALTGFAAPKTGYISLCGNLLDLGSVPMDVRPNGS